MDNAAPIIGKDVIESLTIGMYEDSRFIYREYIQNSADQIDKAVAQGLIKKEDEEIHISINQDKKNVEIYDNATGISQKEALPILLNIAQSTKQRGIDKGFRGIGRLGGLAYCNKLVFETSFKGEDTKTTLIWDADLLKEIINDRKEKEDAVSVIQKVTTSEVSKEDSDKHYFKVKLEGVTNEDLLDKKSVDKYLSMVAPLPFPSRFIYKSLIYEELKKEGLLLDEYRIYLNTEQLYKGYSTSIYKGDENDKRKDDEILHLEFFKEYAKDGQLLFWGWHSISGKNQSLNQINYTRGFRLRKSNIQVGDEYTLIKLQRDRRFQFYFFGEIYGEHCDLIPNSRRDYFSENKISIEFDQKLKHFFHKNIYDICRTASDINSSLKKIEDLKIFDEEYQMKKENGFTNKTEHQEYKDKLEKKIDEAQKAQNKIKKIETGFSKDENHPVNKILRSVVSSDSINTYSQKNEINDPCGKTKFRTDKLSSLNKEQRKLVARIFSVITNVLDKEIAENVIRKIEEELK